MSPRPWGRRDFLVAGGGALSLAVGEVLRGSGLGRLFGPEAGRSPSRSATRSVRLGLVLPSGQPDRTSGIEAGILLGREEAGEVGALLGVALEMRVMRVDRVDNGGRPGDAAAAGDRLLADGVQVLVGALDPRASEELGWTASRARLPFVDALPWSVEPPRITSSTCGSPAFRVGVDQTIGVGLVLEALAGYAPARNVPAQGAQALGAQALGAQALGAQALGAQALGPPGAPTVIIGDTRDPQLARIREALVPLGGEVRILDASASSPTLLGEPRSPEGRDAAGGGASGPLRVVLVGPEALTWAFREGALVTAHAAGAVHAVLATSPIEAGGLGLVRPVVPFVPLVPVHAPALWHPGLIRFGAAQLNERHERRFGTPMDASSWAGWFVVKLLWESILREDAGGNGRPLEARLMDPATRFDGHKGVGIGFRTDGMLRQPLYLVRTDPDGGSEVVLEGPASPRGTPFAAAFDGLAPAAPPCPSGSVGSAPPALPAH